MQIGLEYTPWVDFQVTLSKYLFFFSCFYFIYIFFYFVFTSRPFYISSCPFVYVHVAFHILIVIRWNCFMLLFSWIYERPQANNSIGMKNFDGVFAEHVFPMESHFFDNDSSLLWTMRFNNPQSLSIEITRICML